MNDSPISDRIKQAVDDLDLETRVAAAAEAAEQAVLRGVGLAGGYVHEHRSGIEGLLDRAERLIESRTDGRYAEQVDRVRGQVAQGVAKLAERRPVDPEA